MRRFALTVGLATCLATMSLLATPATGTVMTAPDDDPALRGYYTGNGLLNRGLYDLAADEYRTFLRAHPDHTKAPSARYGLGVCLFRMEQYDAARRELDAIGAGAFAFAPEAEVIKGQCAMNLGDYEGAARLFAAMLEVHPGHDLGDDATSLLAESLYRAARYDAAISAADQLTVAWPESPMRERAEFFGGLAAMGRRDWGGAAGRFDGMTDRFPTGAHVEQGTLLLAQCAHRADQTDDARRAYERVIAQAAEAWVPEALYGLGLLLYDEGDRGDAAVLLDQLLSRFDDHALADSARLLRGRIEYDDGAYDEAGALFTAIEGDDALEAEAAWWLAKCDLRRDRPADAAQRLAEAVERWPDSALRPRMMYDLAVAHVRSDDRAAANVVLASLLDEHPEHELAPEALELFAYSLHQAESYDESQELCHRYLEAHDDRAGAVGIRFLAAENEYLRERYPQSIEAYRAFLARHGEDERARRATFRLGMALYAVGDYEDSETYLAEVVDGADTEVQFRSALLALGDGLFQRGDFGRAEASLDTYLALDPDAATVDDALLKLGLARQRQEKWDDALACYDALLADHADSPHRLHALFERGQVLAARGDDDDAEGAFSEVVEADSSTRFAPWALNHLGTIALRREAWREAADLFERAAAATDDDVLAASARYQAGVALMTERAYADAIDAWDELLDRHPAGPHVADATAQRAIALSRAGRHADALEAIATARETVADDLDEEVRGSLWYEAAWCLRELDRADEARTAYERLLLGHDATRAAVHGRLELGELLMESERWDDAATVLAGFDDRDDAAAPVPDDVREQVVYRQGVCALRAEHYADATRHFEAFLADFDASELRASSSLLCGEALIADGRHADAIPHLERVVEEHPDDDGVAASLLRLGESHATLHQWDESEEVFAAHRERFPDDELWFQAQFGLGWALENQGRSEDAIATYADVIERHAGPTAARAQFQTGECLFALERHEEAARALLRVDILYDYPEWSAAALYEAGRCFEAMNDPVQARRQFEQVRADHADTEWARLAKERIDALGSPGLPGRSSS